MVLYVEVVSLRNLMRVGQSKWGQLFMVETGESPTAQQLTFQKSRWIQIGSIAWLKRVV